MRDKTQDARLKTQDSRRKTQDRLVTSDELRVTSGIPPNPPLEKGGNSVLPLEKGGNSVLPLEKGGNSVSPLGKGGDVSCLESGVLSLGSSKIAFVYSDRIYADIGEHVFPIEKYGLVHQRLIDDGVLNPEDFIEPQMVTTEDLLLVHTKEYVHDLTHMLWTERTIRSELPLTEDIKNSYLLGTGGTILACQKALSSRVAVNLSGGFHHAFPDHAEGFCYTNDVAIAVRRLQRDNQASRFFIVDCDLHQGNGTAYIFRTDSDVFTLSIHQENNYPLKQKSDLDIGLADGADDAVYLAHLQEHVPTILDEFAPGFVIYLAGADPYQDDQLGGLNLTMEGLQRRDEFVIGECLSRSIPMAVLLAGGYAVNTDDTVTIHCNTCEVAYNLWRAMIGA